MTRDSKLATQHALGNIAQTLPKHEFQASSGQFRIFQPKKSPKPAEAHVYAEPVTSAAEPATPLFTPAGGPVSAIFRLFPPVTRPLPKTGQYSPVTAKYNEAGPSPHREDHPCKITINPGSHPRLETRYSELETPRPRPASNRTMRCGCAPLEFDPYVRPPWLRPPR
jgi:hypothetical protein